jgi:hypothetical protein
VALTSTSVRSPFDTGTSLQRLRRSADLEAVAVRLSSAPRDTRTLVAGPSLQAHLLPTRVESLEHVLISRPGYGHGADDLVGFLQIACIDFLLVSEAESPRRMELLSEAVGRLPHEIAFESARWKLYRLHPCS